MTRRELQTALDAEDPQPCAPGFEHVARAAADAAQPILQYLRKEHHANQ